MHWIVTPVSSEPLTEHVLPRQDCKQPHPIAALAQVFGTQSTSSAPPARMRQISPTAHVCDRQKTPEQAPVCTLHAPFEHVATVRPLAAQSS